MIQYIKKSSVLKVFVLFLGLVLLPFLTHANNGQAPTILGIRFEFILFGLILISVAIFHKQTFWVAIIGLFIIILFKLFFAPIHFGEHFFGSSPIIEQLKDRTLRTGEWVIIFNLMGLLLGFAILSKLFEESRIPDILPNYLPDDWKGPFVLLFFVFILSSFLDNIAAAMIGGTIALVVFNHKVHIGFVVAIVAAANAGGAGSVVGDTTTTMMWIDGVSPFNVLHAYVAAGVALLFVAWFASKQQDKYARIQKDATVGIKIDYGKLLIVIMMLIGAIISNIFLDLPALGVWIAILIGALFRKLPWQEISTSIKGTVFLISLVTCASLMPVESLPDASWFSAFILGFVSAVFDNIPLTKLCLEQGHFDWGMLAYSVGFGGSMIWFGSSAGVAITNKFPEARDVLLWVKKGWFVIVAYILGFFVLYAIIGWEPASNNKHKEPAINCNYNGCKVAKTINNLK